MNLLYFMVKLGDKIYVIFSLCSSSNQSKDDFEGYWYNFGLTLDAFSSTIPVLLVTISGFNAKSNIWHTSDTTTFEDSKIEVMSSQFG